MVILLYLGINGKINCYIDNLVLNFYSFYKKKSFNKIDDS